MNKKIAYALTLSALLLAGCNEATGTTSNAESSSNSSGLDNSSGSASPGDSESGSSSSAIVNKSSSSKATTGGGSLVVDGKTYKTVTIGTQVWMAENLNVSVEGSFCYEDKASNCATYGRLYTWDAANSACPTGWHLPTEAEWQKLEVALGMAPSAAASSSEDARMETVIGKTMKSNSNLWVDNSGTNSSGFSALPAGEYVDEYSHLGERANFWTASVSMEPTANYVGDAYFRYLDSEDDYMSASQDLMSDAFSVRCVKN